MTGALPQAAVPAHEAHAHQVQVAGAHLREPPEVPQGEARGLAHPRGSGGPAATLLRGHWWVWRGHGGIATPRTTLPPPPCPTGYGQCLFGVQTPLILGRGGVSGTPGRCDASRSPFLRGDPARLLCLQRKEDARRRAEEEKERMKQVKPVSLCPHPRAPGRGTHGCWGRDGHGRRAQPCAAAAGADTEGGGGCHPPGDPGRAHGAAGGRCR